MAEQSGDDTFSFKAKADVFLEFEKIQVATGELNAHLISCLRCKSKILKPREGTLVEKEVRRADASCSAHVAVLTACIAYRMLLALKMQLQSCVVMCRIHST